MREPVLDVRGFGIRLHTAERSLTVVEGARWSVAAGETLAIVGESGSGKTVSTLGMLGLLPQNVAGDMAGEVLLNGRDILRMRPDELNGVLGGEVGVVFQDPLIAFNPMRRVGPQISESTRRHLRLDRRQARRRAVELLAKVGIPDAADRYYSYPHELSGGMRQRALVAMAIAGEPSLLIADEPTTALDVTTQAQMLELLRQVQREREMGLVLITHDIGVVASMADRVAVMYAGRVVEYGGCESVLLAPDHPYTKGLLGSVPDPREPKDVPFRALPGTPPDLAVVEPGCRFADRCALAEDACRAQVPRLEPPGPATNGDAAGAHLSACWKHPGAHRVMTKEVG